MYSNWIFIFRRVESYPEEYPSGSAFKEGHYIIYFTAKDSAGLPAQTGLAFEVKGKNIEGQKTDCVACHVNNSVWQSSV